MFWEAFFASEAFLTKTSSLLSSYVFFITVIASNALAWQSAIKMPSNEPILSSGVLRYEQWEAITTGAANDAYHSAYLNPPMHNMLLIGIRPLF